MHRDKFERAADSVGSDWKIPLADNVVGLGKSDFGRHYIQKCRETWPDPEKRDDFQKALCQSRTIMITFRNVQLVKGLAVEPEVLKMLVASLSPMFQTLPHILKNPPQNTYDFLETFTKDYGPLFIVLDEIGAAFDDENLSDIAKREKFLSFCHKVIGKWLSLKDVFFVVLGRGSFLSFVGHRHTNFHDFRPPHFQRIGLHLIRPEGIQEIIKKTLVTSTGTETLEKYYKLDQEQLEKASRALFHSTVGHPRSLIDAFRSCHSFEEIMKYEGPHIPEAFNTLYIEDLYRYRNTIEDLIESMVKEKVVDLTQVLEESGGNGLSYDIIANAALIDWEGSAEAALLYTLPRVKVMLSELFLPFQTYLESVSFAINSGMPIDYGNAFELFALKRFQELFPSGKLQLPRETVPLFLDTPVFGRCSVGFSDKTLPLPKITKKGQSDGVSLNSLSTTADKWKDLLVLIDKRSEICGKVRAKSSSSDAFLFTDALFKNAPVRLTLGLAAKNYGASSKFSEKQLDEECRLFNETFAGTDCEKRVNVLVIVCTNYDASIASKFGSGGKTSFSIGLQNSYPNINEVILLDLSTPDKRASFFGTSGEYSQIIESIVTGKKEELANR